MVNRAAILIVLGVLSLAGIAMLTLPSDEGKIKEKEFDAYNIIRKWELPKDLEEVSGIAWLSENRLACVQDEDGIIFIYNPVTSKIEREIEFAGGGDYEGITAYGDNAYVIRSDGEIFEIRGFLKTDPEVNRLKTDLTENQNIESICIDPPNNRLLLGVKDEEEDSEDYKGIYAYNLKEKRFKKDPVFRINLKDQVFKKVDENDLRKVMSPSEIAIHPGSGKIYILDGKNPKLLIMSSEGKAEKVIHLDKDEFAQPEGISFSPSGKMYISNEADDDAANILEVELQENNNKQQ
ncbi:SdiA-regulated domain-containing protein [Autumnicola musiva]|uniref:SdiA-regulated domain-containing protein n=1 Tax=Autumnicola musiva TaxID=3075589 RepID=A0ABU3D5W5_9FLAO|nr:SdiA-regulated domain-containing protein [Zunongwangia sp. F117]MDT0676927.1 SdiA-regulated domain-containing protein [Zunongwangia sp. F117]